MNKFPVFCPACHGTLSVKSLCCQDCGTEVSGMYALPPLLQLTADKQLFLLQFVMCSGSLKEMAALRKLSYPTVRNMLDDIIADLKGCTDGSSIENNHDVSPVQ